MLKEGEKSRKEIEVFLGGNCGVLFVRGELSTPSRDMTSPVLTIQG